MSSPLALIIDNAIESAKVYSIVLQNEGYVVNTITNGAQAVAFLNSNTPQLIILDLYMLYISGNNLLDYIKQEPRFEHTQILLTTMDLNLAMPLRPFVDDILKRPVSMAQLTQAIQKLNKPP